MIDERRILEVEFTFRGCRFLQQNAVAFLGGLARLIEHRAGTARFNWNTLQDDICTTLNQNTFLACFGAGRRPWRGNSISYKEYPIKSRDNPMDYLKARWPGRSWPSLGPALGHAIVGRALAIFENAFDPGFSPGECSVMASIIPRFTC